MKGGTINPLTNLVIGTYDTQLSLLEAAKKAEITLIPSWLTLHHIGSKDSSILEYPIKTVNCLYLVLHIGQKKYNLVPTWQMFSCPKDRSTEVCNIKAEIAGHLIEFAKESEALVQFVSIPIMDDHRLHGSSVPELLARFREDCLQCSTYKV